MKYIALIILTIFMLCNVAVANTLQDYSAALSRNTASESCLPGSIRAALGRVRASCGKVRVISTFRRNARIAGSGRPSYHATCRAADFVADYRCAMRVLAGWVGGLSKDPWRVRHLHMDTGPKVRFNHYGKRKSRKWRPRHRERRAKEWWESHRHHGHCYKIEPWRGQRWLTHDRTCSVT